MTKWRIRWGGSSLAIERVEATRESDKWVYVMRANGNGERREAKSSRLHAYFDTWDQAHEAAMTRAERELTTARLALARAQGHFGNVRGWTPPDVGRTV